MDEVKAKDFEWNKFASMVQVVRAEMSPSQFKELKSLAVINGKTLQKFVGDILKQTIRQSQKKGG